VTPRGREAVVTGMGAVSPLGIGLDATWRRLLEGPSGVRRISKFDASAFPVTLGAEVPGFQAEAFVEDGVLRAAMDRPTQFALAAARMAMEDAGLPARGWDRGRAGIYLGMTGFNFSDYDRVGAAARRAATGRPGARLDLGGLGRALTKDLDPLRLRLSSPIAGTLAIARQFGVAGPFSVVSTACAAGGQAIGAARQAIARGEADVVITGGTEESVNPIKLLRFCLLGALSRRNAEPERASRPFDAQRDGFVLADGAGVLVLEAREHAERRGARVYGRVAGFGASSDAYRITDVPPDGGGAVLAMRRALADAGLGPDAVDYVNAHGTSTKVNDVVETRALKQVFGERAYALPVSSTKSMTGHLVSAAGAVECIIALLALRHQVIPPTATYEVPDPECDLDYVPGRARPARLGAVLSNSFGFGGQNVALLVCREPSP
jgi:3-oxoacyl-[acyl-carrier-protein] synthase II